MNPSPLPTRPCQYRGCNGGEVATGTYELETGAADRYTCPGCGGREFQVYVPSMLGARWPGMWCNPVSLSKAEPALTYLTPIGVIH